MARRPFSSGFPGLRFRSGPLARSCCATPPIPARLILLFSHCKNRRCLVPCSVAPSGLSKNRHFFANKPLRLIQLSSPTKLMTRLAKKTSPEQSLATQTMYRHHGDVPPPRRRIIILTKPCHPDEVPSS